MDSLIEKLQQDGKQQDINGEALKKEHLTQISFFCHERLIHLIVTVVFALLEMLSLMLTVLSGEIYTMLLTVVILILLILRSPIWLAVILWILIWLLLALLVY